jgi:YfiH family protein
MAVLVADRWDIRGLVHGFLSRMSSQAPVAATDGKLLADGMTPVQVVVPRQVHGIRIATITAPPDTAPEADGLLTATPGFAVGITTADCVPLLLFEERARIAAAVHAGWRGTLAGIVTEAVAAVRARTPTSSHQLRAAIGPAAGPCCYEVGPEVRAAFEDRYGAAFVAPAFTTPRTRPHLDLRVLVRAQLEAAGLAASAIQTLGPCTVCDSAFASYRRDGWGAGRQLSFVGWTCDRF